MSERVYLRGWGAEERAAWDRECGRRRMEARGAAVILPERIKVGPFVYGVALVEETRRDDDRKCAGTCNYVEQRIEIQRDLPPDRHREVFFHEVLHAVDDTLSIGLSEKQVRRLSVGLTMFLLDNGLLKED